MGRNLCATCELDVKTRRLVEGLMRHGVSVYNIADYLEFLKQRGDIPNNVSKSSLDRHKNSDPAHFDLLGKTIVINESDEVKNLREFVGDMFIRFQKANKDKIPTHKEMIDLLLADAKLADIEQRRKDENLIKGLLLGASYKANIVEVKQRAHHNDPRPDGGDSLG